MSKAAIYTQMYVLTDKIRAIKMDDYSREVKKKQIWNANDAQPVMKMIISTLQRSQYYSFHLTKKVMV